MFLLAGLGNPGARYAGNRHNVGFMALDTIASAHSFGSFTAKFGGQVSEGKLAGIRTLLFKPMTFMNCSGEPLGELARFYKIPTEALCVIHDELDIEPGKLRVKRGGGHGGHNGLRSIDQHLGQDYARVRVGIGHPGHKDRVSDYVLSDFSADEAPIIDKMLTAIAKHAPLLAKGEEKDFSNQLALTLNPPAAKPAVKPQAKPATDADA